MLRELWDDGFVIEAARGIEHYSGDDDRSVAANNTSAFNCRAKTAALLPDGTPAPTEFSVHSYGSAIDLNPRTNPYFKPRDVAAWQAWTGAAGEPLPRRLERYCVEDAARCVVIPPSGAPFLERSTPGAGKLRAGERAVEIFTRRGWRWGGAWPTDERDKVRTDTQHLERPISALQ